MGSSGTNKPKKEIVNKENSEIYIEPNQDIKKLELFTGHKPVPMNIANKTLKSICKIIIKTINKTIYGTGFFLNINDSKKYFILPNLIA